MRGTFTIIALLGFAFQATAQEQSTDGACSPAIAQVAGNVTITCVVSNSASETVDIATRNIDFVVNYFRAIRNTNELIIPATWEYKSDPTPAKWAALVDLININHKILVAAIQSTLLAKPYLPEETIGAVDELLKFSNVRTVLLYELLQKNEPMRDRELDDWYKKYYKTVEDLTGLLSVVKSITEYNTKGTQDLSKPASSN